MNLELEKRQDKDSWKVWVIGITSGLILAASIIWYSMPRQTLTEPSIKPTVVHITVVIQSNVDWECTVTRSGPDSGFDVFSGSENKTYEYDVSFIKFEITGIFDMYFFGEHIIIYDGYVRIAFYVDGKLHSTELIKATSTYDTIEWTYKPEYS